MCDDQFEMCSSMAETDEEYLQCELAWDDCAARCDDGENTEEQCFTEYDECLESCETEDEVEECDAQLDECLASCAD